MGTKPANRFGLDYEAEARALGKPPTPIIDFHTHVNGKGAVQIWSRVAELYGITKVITMVRLADAMVVKDFLGEQVEFIAFPDFRSADRGYAMRDGFLVDIQRFHDEHNSKMIKLWNAPRMRELFPGESGADLVEFDGAARVKQVELAQKLGMGVMVHIADPDTWFATKYADASMYGSKRSYYRGLEVMLARFRDVPWVAAHMGGYAEDLDFLDGLLERHPNLSLDTSATKWVVRELSRHPRERVIAFFTRWQGRIFFGSDVVTIDEHLAPKAAPPPAPVTAPSEPATPSFHAEGVKKPTATTSHPMADLADSPESAFELYASRYLALRLIFETKYEGESPIADPDLHMVDPQKHDGMSAPMLQGLGLPAEMLKVLYRDAAAGFCARLGIPV